MDATKTETRELGLGEALASAMATFYGGLKAQLRRQTRAASLPDSRVAELVQCLMRDGYAVLPDYYSQADCAAGRAEIDTMIAAHPQAIQSFGEGSDLRLFGSEHAASLARRFHDDAFIRSVGEAYRRGSLANFSTLAARLTARPGNLGSGQGWHRDAFYFQFKSMVYLSDVDMSSGPFELLPGSHRVWQVTLDSLTGRLEKPPASRITATQMARLLALRPDRAKPFPARAGTVILFDSSTIHRGMPIQSGTRYAMTNYFFPPAHVTPALRRQFAPMLAP